MVGIFFGTAHTLANYTTAFYEPLVSDWSNFETWSDNGGKTAFERANLVYRQKLEEYQAPEMDGSLRQALEEYANERRRELGNDTMKLQERVSLFQDRLQQVISQSGLNRSAFASSIKVDRLDAFAAVGGG